MSEQAPTATELREQHTKNAMAVEFLGRLATNKGDRVDFAENKNVPFNQAQIPGYETGIDVEEYSLTAPAGAQVHLEKTAAEAQRALDKSDAQGGKVVTRNLDKFIQEAQVDMTKDVVQQHNDNLREVEMYAQTRGEYPELHEGVVARAQEYTSKHKDVLGEGQKAA